jgi:hypothetical protein
MDSPLKRLNTSTSNLVLRCQKPSFTPLARAKGVWLEMGDNIRHFMDVALLSFSQHPKSIPTLYPHAPKTMANSKMPLRKIFVEARTTVNSISISLITCHLVY